MTRPTSLAAHKARRQAAQRPAPRTVSHTIEGGRFDGWTATMRVDWPAAWMKAVEAGELDGILMVLDRALIDHNMPDATGEIATSAAEIDPAEGMATMAAALFDAMGKLPPR